ncbi:hypothetical protein C8R47DRAFT_998747 [Mycena vitilis]|nr:hypothetical protein C8R47DRAFT_998747 [Mycena vitilis]
MEWADRLAWHDLSFHWRAWTPVVKEKTAATKWYLKRPDAAYCRLTERSSYMIRSDLREEIANDLTMAFDCVDEIMSKDAAFHKQPRPVRRFSYEVLNHYKDTAGEIYKTIMNAQRQMLDCLGLIYWWTSVCANWDNSLTYRAKDAIDSFDLSRYSKRGVIVDLARDWQGLNIPLLVEHKVPFVYAWTIRERNHRRYARLNPQLLLSLHDLLDNAGSIRNLTFDKAMWDNPGFQALSRFDLLLLEKKEGTSVAPPNRSARPPKKATAFVIEFPGWGRHVVPARNWRNYYFDNFQFTVRGNEIVFRRWEPCAKEIGRMFRLMEAGDDDQTDDRSFARERYKGSCAPRPGQDVSSEGSFHSAPGEADSGTATLPRTLSERVGPPIDEKLVNRDLGSRLTSPPTASKSVDRGKRKGTDWHNRNRSPPRRAPPRSQSRSSHSLWQESDASGRYPPRGRSWGENRGSSNGESSFRPRSASPPRAGSSRTESSRRPSPGGSRIPDGPPQLQITLGTSVFTISPAFRWAKPFFENAVLVLNDPVSLVKFRYWAAFMRVETALDLLNLAIARCVGFRLAIPDEKIRLFRPPVVSNMEREVVPHYYRMGYLEAQLSWGSGGAEFTGAYMIAMGNIMSRPHAIALVPQGGIFTWLVHQYRPDLIRLYMQGPSTQVTIHNRGKTDSNDAHPWYVLTDEMSEPEMRVLLGHTKEGAVDYFMFPSNEWMWDTCRHYSGECGTGVQVMLETIAKEIRDGRPKRRALGEFKEFMRRWSRGRNEPERGLPLRSDFEDEKARIDRMFAEDWSKIKLTDIRLPGHFR